MHLPLEGKQVIVTRAQDKQAEAKKLFLAEGAKVLDLPALVITPPDRWDELDESISALDTFHWIIFSSSNGVLAFEERLQRVSKSLASSPATLKIAAVGRKTAQTLTKLGAFVDFVPPNFVADSLIANFPISGSGLRILIPRVQSGGRTILAESFLASGSEVVEVAAYQSCCPGTIPERTVQALIDSEVDAFVFTSGKTVAHSYQLLSKSLGSSLNIFLDGVKLISIGPQTSISCHKYFNRLDKEADTHDLEGLVQACINCFMESS